MVTVPTRAEELVTDVSTTRMVEIMNSKSNLRCRICVKDALAYAICSNCRDLLCKTCAEAHGRAVKTLEHEMLLLSEMRSLVGTAPTAMYEEDENCPYHLKKLLTFYCRREGELLCEDCVTRGVTEKHASVTRGFTLL